ncbi:MAG: hypothetical protein LBT85_02190, partial [Bifidobacteriaceae bacterium]|jgi:hypothetical protein|nr:hypothetical protein [Bifidobacteriaceae bacterium]
LNKIGDVLKTTIIDGRSSSEESDNNSSSVQSSNVANPNQANGANGGVAGSSAKDTSNIFRLNTTNGFDFSGLDDYNSRTTQNIFFIILLISVFIGFAAIIIRRIEFASAMHAGVKKTKVLLQVLAESALWIVPSVIITLPVIFYFAIFESDGDILSFVNIAFRIIVSGVFGALLGVVLAALSVREKSLFKYFKGR